MCIYLLVATVKDPPSINRTFANSNPFIDGTDESSSISKLTRNFKYLFFFGRKDIILTVDNYCINKQCVYMCFTILIIVKLYLFF